MHSCIHIFTYLFVYLFMSPITPAAPQPLRKESFPPPVFTHTLTLYSPYMYVRSHMYVHPYRASRRLLGPSICQEESALKPPEEASTRHIVQVMSVLMLSQTVLLWYPPFLHLSSCCAVSGSWFYRFYLFLGIAREASRSSSADILSWTAAICMKAVPINIPVLYARIKKGETDWEK